MAIKKSEIYSRLWSAAKDNIDHIFLTKKERYKW